MKLKDLRIFSNIPVIGTPYYWWLGGGRTKEKKKFKLIDNNVIKYQ